ncbi:DUF2339 domain-containing protein [Sphingomonas sp. LB-2]|uniref:DUF2339 domain-containing protein n=1 Tax=Sphingomonas caeni TaxID=2984949 RepID=UPI0022303F7A|nr:DUF2339 domain-containing protein [Sphingomonas caeni]MCW3846318.1 DUF2339 domain-containing protein [Sphingomonas caeni]
MTALVLFLLIVACAILWQRVSTLEKRLENLRELLFAGAPRHYERPAAPAQPLAAAPAEVRTALEPEPLPAPAPRPAPPPPPPAIPVFEDEPERAPRRMLGFEDIFGRYLPIWAGGITLAVAGFLIVKYSIDAGLLSPAIRVVLGLLFGTGLIAAAEVALRSHRFVIDDRIRQALAGAGIATLYASILVAANLYHLVDPMTAFVGLALVTALAAGLSLRFGAPSAVLGLVGGLAAPALVGAESPNVPLLATYLALTVGGLCALGRNQRWWWLGALAVLGGFGWGALLILGGLHDTASVLAVGTLTLLFAIAFPLLLVGNRSATFRLAAAVAGCAQMAAIVATGNFAPLEWGMFALFSVAIVFLSRRQSLLAQAPLIGLGTGALLAMSWNQPDPAILALVLAGGTAIYGGPALWRLWRSDGNTGDALQLAGLALAVALIPLLHFHDRWGWQTFSTLAFAGAALAAFAAALGWRHPDRLADPRFALVSVPAIGLALLAAALALPDWALAPATAAAAAATLLLALRSQDRRIAAAAHAFGMAALIFLISWRGLEEMAHAAGFTRPVAMLLPAILRWLVPAAAALAFARWSPNEKARAPIQCLAVLLFYIAFAQPIAEDYLALLPATVIAGLALTARDRAVPALATAGALSLAWAVQPLAGWLVPGFMALVGIPLYVTALPDLVPVAIRIAAPTLALALVLWRTPLPPRLRRIGAIETAALATIAVHIVWKHLFAIPSPDAFIAHGLAERTLWELLLLAAACAAWRLDARRIATGLGLASLLHLTWFSLMQHNPLWDLQAVGPWLVPLYGTGFGLIWLSRHVSNDDLARRARGLAQIVLILLFALSALGQAFHGTVIMLGEVGQAEDIWRSLLAIGIAIGFLQWGIRTSSRDWRIASLVLMLAAVGKVFLRDAAGLDGLLRIASFAALGFSLIGVGWLYSRYLPDSRLRTGND